MGNTTPNIGIYVPSAGETNYDQSFLSGMVNVDQHDHSGGPNKGVPITTAGIAAGSITFDKLNANVADNTTGIGTDVGPNANKLIILGLLKNIFQLAAASGFISKDGTLAHARTLQGTTDQIAITNPAGVAGDPVFSFAPITVNATQPAFLATAAAQPTVTGQAAVYTATFTAADAHDFDQGSNFDGTSTFTAPRTGVYMVHADLSLGAITALNTTAEISIAVNGTGEYSDFNGNLGAIRNAGNGAILSINQIMKLAATDTVTITIAVTGEASENVGILDGTFGAVLLC